MVKKEWRCLAHGPFDGLEGVCPSGCTTVVREFRTAPGTRSPSTKKSDAALEHLAARYNLTDMTNKNGSVGGSRPQQQDMAPVWGAMPKGNVFEVGKGEVQRDGSEGGATAALSSMKIPGKIGDEPNFMDIAKTLPRVKPRVAKEHSFGTSSDLDSAISKA